MVFGLDPVQAVAGLLMVLVAGVFLFLGRAYDDAEARDGVEEDEDENEDEDGSKDGTGEDGNGNR